MKQFLAISLALAAVGGCAGGAWLESPSEAELPLEQPAHRYPTAVRPALAQIQQSQVQQPQVQQPLEAMPLDPSPAPAAPPKQGQIEQPRLPAPALAVVPQQLQRPPAETTLAVPATPATTQPTAAALAPIVSASALRASLPATEQPAVRQVAADAPAPGSITPITLATPESSPEQRREAIERHRKELIAALETEIRERRAQSSPDDELPRLEQQLRLAYLLAERLDDAVAAVDSLEPPQREAYKDLMFGLGVWLSPDEARRAPLRSAKVLRSLREATTDLAMASKLELRNLAFVEKVESFGWYTALPRNEFAPKQEALLYVEIENFSVEHKNAAGFETELQGRYQILDAGGQIVAERELPLDKEVCRNYRRDYFLAYRIYIPEAIAPGKYRLELSIEDRKAGGKYPGRKFGEGMIEFTVR